MMQDMNMAGVVARPKRATRTPLLVRPATSAAASSGPVMRGSRPTCALCSAYSELRHAKAATSGFPLPVPPHWCLHIS